MTTRIEPLTDAEVAAMIREKHQAWANTGDREVVSSFPQSSDFIHAAYALAASRVDTAARERAAASRAWTAAVIAERTARVYSTHQDLEEYLAREYPAPTPRECRKLEGDFFGVPLYSDPNCPADRVVFEYEGKAVACALIHPDSTALRRNAAQVGQ